MNGPIEQEAAALTPANTAPQVAAEILRAVRQSHGLPAETAIHQLPTRERQTDI